MDTKTSNRLLVRTGFGYVVILVALVAAARLGLLPGSGEVLEGGHRLVAQPYRLAMGVGLVFLALYLGAWAALLGVARRSWPRGLAALVAGGVATGLSLSLAPWFLYPNDQYPVTFMWLLGGAPVGLITWIAVTLAWRRGGGGGRVVAA